MRNTQGTNDAFGAQKGFLGYATHFLKHSVLKTGFSGTEGIFGTGNTLLRYGISTRCAEQPPTVRDAFSEALGAQNSLLRYAMRFRRHFV